MGPKYYSKEWIKMNANKGFGETICSKNNLTEFYNKSFMMRKQIVKEID